jgi:hypothetical protein
VIADQAQVPGEARVMDIDVGFDGEFCGSDNESNESQYRGFSNSAGDKILTVRRH